MDKKEIKKQYKQSIPKMGVYQVKNLVNGKLLIGSGREINGKLNSIRFQLNHGSHPNSALQQDFKFGEKNFTFEVLDYLEAKENNPDYDYSKDLKSLEEMWLEKLHPYGERGYNKKKGQAD